MRHRVSSAVAKAKKEQATHEKTRSIDDVKNNAPLQIRLDSPSLHVHHARVAEDMPFSDRVCAKLVELRIELRQASNKLVSRRLALQFGGDQRSRTHGLVTRRQGTAQRRDEAGEDGELARNVRAVEVVGRVGLLDNRAR